MTDPWESAADDDASSQTPTDKDIAREIDRLLTAYRPERYNEREDQEWKEPVYALITDMLRNRMTADQIARADAEKRVNGRESGAPQRLNTILRGIFKKGQIPLGWGTENWREMFQDELSLPVAIKRKRGGLIIAHERIRFGAMTVQDGKEWESAFRRDTEEHVLGRKETVDGFVIFRELAEDQGVLRFDEIRVEDDAN
jgi:hypothetical protein